MQQPKGYVLSPELKRAVQQVVLQHMASFQPRPQTGRRPRRGRGGVADGTPRALATATSDIPAATEDNGDRTPGTGSVALIYAANDPPTSDWENWSLTPIPAGTYVVGIVIDDHMIIVDAFC